MPIGTLRMEGGGGPALLMARRMVPPPGGKAARLMDAGPGLDGREARLKGP